MTTNVFYTTSEFAACVNATKALVVKERDAMEKKVPKDLREKVHSSYF